MTATTPQTIRYRQTDNTGVVSKTGDVVDIAFSPDGEDIEFSVRTDCGGLSCQELITQDARYIYVYGEKVERPPLRASLRGDGSVFRHVFETTKGKAQIIVSFNEQDEGQSLTLTHQIPGYETFSRCFVQENREQLAWDAPMKKAA